MGEELKEKLFYKKENGWEKLDTKKREDIFEFSNKYMSFLNKAKTEREFIVEAVKVAKEKGFKDLSEYSELRTGDKVYFVNREKSMYMAIIGEEKLENGIHIIGSHVD